MYTCQKADEYIEKNRVDRADKPEFHLTTPVGWLNDPNGFSIYGGKAHLFYQFHPYSTEWGPMHWGHSTSDDFIRWEELPTALAPDSDYDAFGCFSGTAIENDGKHVLFYTGVVEEKLADGTKNVIQNQCMAVGDGISYEKISSNPVVDGKIMPEECSRADFRDPKVWKDADGRYYMLAGNRTYDGIPQVVLFSSDDMYNWKFESVFAKDETGRFGAVWECPDYFEMDGHNVLIVSPQDMSADGEFHNGNNVVFFTGDVDEERHIFKYEKAVSVDSGFDFYAPQTIRTPDGRRVMIGWMQSWDSVNTLPRGQKWACMMSVPRELMISDGKLIQTPVRELCGYRQNKLVVNDTLRGEKTYEGINGRVIDMTVDIKKAECGHFTMHFAKDEIHETNVSYTPGTQMLEIDRTFAGWIRDTNCVRKVKIKNGNGLSKMRIVMDWNSIEIFVNDGEQVLSTVIYTPRNAQDIVFETDGCVELEVEKYDLNI